MNDNNPIFDSLEIIEKRISEKLTVGSIASGVYFSKYHYQRLFREIVGDSVMEYVTRRKLTLAGKELLESGASVLDIALKFGFDSHEGFTRSFRAYMGVTPTDYRRYGLAAISQRRAKERFIMTYSKVSDEIIRELNAFIVKARETASSARKDGVPEYASFWNTAADTADRLADRVNELLRRIAAIAERPDEITSRFAILKTVEDIAFSSNLLAFNVGLMVSRGQPAHVRAQEPICEKFVELARASALKAEKAAGFFGELSALIFDDMRKTAAQRIKAVTDKGASVLGDIGGYSYIKDEIAYLIDGFAKTPPEKITASFLENSLFKLNIISFAAEMEVCRNPKDAILPESIAALIQSVHEAIESFQTLAAMESAPAPESAARGHFTDIAFQGNILLFYIKGEVSKLGTLIDGAQKEAFDQIRQRLFDCIHFTHNAADESAYAEIAKRLQEINAKMTAQADGLGEHGGAVRFLADEIGRLADRVARCVPR